MGGHAHRTHNMKALGDLWSTGSPNDIQRVLQQPFESFRLERTRPDPAYSFGEPCMRQWTIDMMDTARAACLQAACRVLAAAAGTYETHGTRPASHAPAPMQLAQLVPLLAVQSRPALQTRQYQQHDQQRSRGVSGVHGCVLRMLYCT